MEEEEEGGLRLLPDEFEGDCEGLNVAWLLLQNKKEPHPWIPYLFSQGKYIEDGSRVLLAREEREDRPDEERPEILTKGFLLSDSFSRIALYQSKLNWKCVRLSFKFPNMTQSQML